MQKTNKSNRIYFSFSTRMIISIMLFIVFISFGVFLIHNSLTINGEKYINYKDYGDVDYKVHLLPNNFYEQEYLGKNMLYVASLIDQIVINYNYSFESDDDLNMSFSYNVKADLIITNKTGTKSFYEKTYVLLKDQNLEMTDGNNQRIREEIKVNYSNFNQIANNFRTSYGVETESKLNVYMTVYKKNASYKVDENNRLNITIPLSQKAVEIQMKANDINSKSKFLKSSEMLINDYIKFGVGSLFIVAALITMISIAKKVLTLVNRKSSYDRMLEKILKEYDRLIAESSTLASFDNKNIIKVEKFTELLDIHDNLQLPIIYYEITKHQKSYFYINHIDTIYLFVLKATDLEVSKNEKER